MEMCKNTCSKLTETVPPNSAEFEKTLIFRVLGRLDKNVDKLDFNAVMKLTEDMVAFVNEMCTNVGGCHTLARDNQLIHYGAQSIISSRGFTKRDITDAIQKGLKKSLFTQVISNIIFSPDFIFPEYSFKSYLPHEEFVPIMVEDVRKYFKAVEKIHFNAVLKVKAIVENYLTKNPTIKLKPKEVSAIYNCVQHLFWPQILKSLKNTVDSALKYVRISGIAYFKNNQVLLVPDEKEIFNSLAQMLKIYEEEDFSLSAIVILGEKIEIPQFDYAVEVHKYLLKLYDSINEDFKVIRDYYNEAIMSCLARLDEGELNARRDEGFIFSEERLEKLASHYASSEEYIMNTVPQVYYYKVYRFESEYLLDELLQISENVKNKVSNYIKECTEQEIYRFKNKLNVYDEIAKREVTSGKELAYIHKTVIEISTTGLEEMVSDLKKLYKVIFAAISCDPTFSSTIKNATDIYFSLVSLKENCKDACNNLESQKFSFEESILSIPKLVVDEIDYYDVYHIHGFSEVRRYDKIEQVYLFVKKIKKWLSEKVEMIDFVHSEQTALNIPKSVVPSLEELKIFVACFDKLVTFLRTWNVTYWTITNGPIQRYTLDDLEKIIEENYRALLLYQKYFQGHIKNAVIEQLRFRYDAKYPHSSDSSEGEGGDEKKKHTPPGPLALIVDALEEVRYLKGILPILGILTNERLSLRHWQMMSEISGKNMVPFISSSLKDYLELGIEEYLDQFEAISTNATREYLLRETLAKMKVDWTDIMLKLIYSPKVETKILGSLDEVQALLDDHMVKTMSMKGSAFVKPFEAEVNKWFEMLTNIHVTLDEWGKVQIQWMYFMPIFSSQDIVSQMPAEGELFREVDTIYLKLLTEIIQRKYARIICNDPSVLDRLRKCLKNFEVITDGVNSYLEKKRLYFPRFFFLSNDDMLEILSETKDPLRVQPHLRKCFEGIDKLGFSDTLEIYSMFSVEQEEVDFSENIKSREAGGSVEKWLVWVEDMMKMSVRDTIERSLNAYSIHKRKIWIQEWPGQVVLCGTQIAWTSEVQKCFETSQLRVLKRYHSCLEKQLKRVIKLVRGYLSTQARTTLCALVVLDVHCKDVTLDLYNNGVINDADFQWLAQLRYYWFGDVKVKITNATVKYAYEYLGNTPRLVITPLTDRCYRTLVGAYSLHLNGAPEGPAGTGKTETTKDLAKALAVQCVVFNCSDGLNYKAMGKFFKGLASSGAWACFDEFNRIDIEVLSVVAQQILCIVQAVRKRLLKFDFEGTRLNLNRACYVCITMNPGYAGRSELPDNLKVLFRTVAMMVPDYALIGEISLYSYGFLDARALSVKIVTTYKLCSEQLSSQSHYDYGMRAVKTVLQAAGNLKIRFPDDPEDILLLRSIIDVNLPKFLKHDVVLFNGIISDLFPGIQLPPMDYTHLMDCSREICKERNLQPRDSFLAKVIQTYETMVVRHGFMLVGDPFSGKTSTLVVLSEGLTRMKSKYGTGVVTKFQTLNPKSVTMGELYGEADLVSNEWKDGIIADIYRSFARETTPDRKWVVFDGPVDAVWIENMNTVLDDNKKLCLNSGEVIQMTPVMSMIFEVMDLIQASPATVSRCGMIYMESETLGWRPIAESWSSNLPAKWFRGNRERILSYYDWIIPPCLEFISKYCKKIADAGVTNAVKSTLHYFEAVFTNATASIEEDFPYFVVWLQATIMNSVLWGIAGTLDQKSRSTFDEFYRKMWEEKRGYPPQSESLEIQTPLEGLIEDNTFVFYGKGRWLYWPNKLTSVEEGSSGLIDTIESCKYMEVMDLLCKFKKPFILTGPTGTGKTMYFQKLLMTGLNLEKFCPSFIAFTANISARFCQDLVLTKLLKRNRITYGPPYGMTSVIFVDDINMPAKEIYGAQPPLELLRQFFDYGYWYEKNKKLFLEDMIIIAAMGTPGGSRQEVSPRILRHFALIGINGYSSSSVIRIYSAIANAGFRKNGFSAEFIPMTNLIIAATLEIYNSAMVNLLPTPAKCHYLFNLRDFFRVVQGLLLIRKESVSEKKTLIRLWVHEILRVFYDRLITEADKEWLFHKIKTTVKDVMKETFDTMLDGLSDSKEVPQSALTNLIFTNALDTENEDDKKYEEIPSIEVFQQLAIDFLDTYNSMHKSKMNVVLFSYALHHLSRICRILSTGGGCGLLVGVSGSGRQSVVKLAASIYEFNIFQPEITANYGFDEWRGELKGILKESGGKNRNVVFLFCDSQIKEEYFLQDIDSLLNTGEVPNIFPLDEISEVYEMVRLAAAGGDKNANVTDFVAFAYFVKRCKKNLHLMLAFSPIGSAFRLRARMYPSLINCCTIDWFVDWPADALECVAEKYLAQVTFTPEIKSLLVGAFKQFHIIASEESDKFYQSTGRKLYVTSASYVEFIKCYSALVKKSQEELILSKERYLGGLDKLHFAAVQVEIMQRDLENLQPLLKVAAAETTEMLERIKVETAEVTKTSEQVKVDEIEANRQAVEAQALKEDCEKDLAVAMPILEDAIAALDTLTPKDITLVKSMKNPPSTVKLVMEAVCVMLGIKPDKVPDPDNPGRMMLDFWPPSKRLLGEMGFLKGLKDYDKDNISPAVMKTIRAKYLTHKDFQPDIVAKASSAAKGLCKWIHALNKYDVVIKEVAPKKEKLKLAEEQYAKVKADLDAKRALLKTLEEKLEVLRNNLNDALERKQKLTDEILLCSKKLEKAKQIIGSLGGEQKRWGLMADKLQGQIDNIPGDILISCGIIGYLSPLSLSYRNEIIKDWLKLVQEKQIPHTPDYTLRGILGSEVSIQAWVINGLPNDEFSVDNAIIMDSTLKWSLLIDPQSQGNKWLKMVYRDDIRVIRLTQKTEEYMNYVSLCVQGGKPLLLENIGESLDPVLNPLIKQEYFYQGSRKYLALGDNVLIVHNNFKFVITTKLRNPHFMPEIYNNLTVINFSLTEEGLSDQLLAIVVAKERPELDKERQSLIEESSINKKTLENAEKKILFLLSSVKGNILEDDETINTLEASKKLAERINKKEIDAIDTRNRIESVRLKYVSIAQHCASLYYTIDLQVIDPMYQFSLVWFIQIYIQSVEKADPSPEIRERLSNIQTVFNYNLYLNIVRSLFAKDKILYSFIFCTTIMKKKGLIKKREFEFLLTGGIGLENPIPNPTNWLPNKSWDEICRVIEVPKFEEFKTHFENNLDAWKELFYIPTPTKQDIPEPWRSSLSDFQMLIVIRLIRPDQLVPLIVKFVEREVGAEFVRPPQFNLRECFLSATQYTPLIFILSPGVDPMQSLLDLSKEHGKERAFDSISLGQGQGPIAENMIRRAMKIEGWVCLQNCHLLTSWMPRLEQICEELSYEVTLPKTFRLWLTSYPTNKFPVSILESGIKMVNEAPTGLKNSLLRTYTTDPVKTTRFYNACNKNDKGAIFCRLLLGISFFHAVVQERCRYGPIGWNIPYGFNESDYLISIQQLKNFVKKYDYIPFAAVLYLTGECNYGGRVTDNWDRRALNTLLQQYVCEAIIYDKNYSLVKDDPVYKLPVGHSRPKILQFIKDLPDVIPPELYGLHTNAEITRNILNTKIFINSLQLVSGGTVEGEGDSDQLIYSIAHNILIKLPNNFDIRAAMQKYPTEYSESMNTVLSQEMERFNRLLNVIRNNMIGLKKAVQGEVVMDKDLEMVANSLMISKIPVTWAKYTYPSLKPLGAYIKNFLERLDFLQKWYDHGKPKSFWLSGFFFTHAFLSGILQNFARKYKIEIDKLTFDFEVMKTKGFKPEDGVIVYGLFIDGARWDRKKFLLAEQNLKVLSDELPELWIKPIVMLDLDIKGRYVCPVYRTSERKGVLSTTGHSTNYVLPIYLETPVAPEHWIKRGVALLLDLDD